MGQAATVRKEETDLVELKTNETGDKRRRRRNSGNDLTRDLLRRVAVGGGDAVVHRTQVGRGSDEIDMIVRIIVLLELNWVQAIADKRRRGRELLDKVLEVGA